MKARVILLASCLVAACATTNLPSEAGDEKLVIRASDLAQFGLELPPDYQQHETLHREPDVDATTVVYEFQVEGIYVQSLAILHRKPGTACDHFDELNQVM